jgi:hypothetical protein
MLRAMSATSLRLARTQAGVRTVAEALFHGGSRPAPAARLDWVAQEVTDIVRHAGPRARLLFQLCLLAVHVLAPLSIGRLRRLARLDVQARIRALDRLERTGSGAALVLALKALLCTVFYEHPDSAREVGAYEPCDDPRTPRRGLPVLKGPELPPPPPELTQGGAA